MRANRIALMGILVSLSLILGWVEHMIPISAAVPGIKLGIGNIVVVFALYRLGRRDALIVSCSKVLLSALLFGGISGFAYSLAGALFSFAAMLLLYRNIDVSAIGVSAAGGAVHICAQIAIAITLTSTPQIWRFLPILLAVGTLSGVLTGFAAQLVLNRTDNLLFK